MGGDADPDKLDEDLSELEKDDCQERSTVNHPGDGDEGSECDAKEPDLDGNNNEGYGSEAWDGDSEADREYERQQARELKLKARELAMTKEEEVSAAYEPLCEAEEELKTIPIGSLAGQEFKLFCSDYVEHVSGMASYTSKVEFFHHERSGRPCVKAPESNGGTNMLHGTVSFGEHEFEIAPFCPPRHRNREALITKVWDGYQLSFTFIDDRHLKLRVPPQMVKPYADSDDLRGVPEMFSAVVP